MARPIRVRMESPPVGERVRTELTAEVAAPSQVIQRLVWEMDAWPGLLPHVQSVEREQAEVYRVRATWRGIPLTSLLRREPDDSSHRIVFQCSSGFARGCYFSWVIDEINESRCAVRLSIERKSRFGLVNLMIGDLARQTLAMVTLLAEADAAAHALA
ncbi:MAG: hypothetical protein M9890_08675 [Thermomicrobiales bacterium]|nr:hypothetical protein [Thermomicrobiales bacterium]